MNTLNIAWRNVRRNGRRSLMTFLALVVGTLGILLFGGYVNDTVGGLQTATVRTYGHLQILPKDYLDFGRGNPARFSIRGYEQLITKIREDAVLSQWVTLATPMLDMEGVAGNFASSASTNFVGEGVVPAERRRQLAWDGFGIGIPPTLTALSEDTPQAGVVGLGLAQLLNLCDGLALRDCKRQAPAAVRASTSSTPGDLAALSGLVQDGAGAKQAGPGGVAVELLAASPNGLPNVIRMNVLQAERQGIRQIDSMYVAMPLGMAQRLVFGPELRAVSSIVVQLKHTDLLPAAQARLNELIRDSGEPLEVLNFHQVSPVYDQIIGGYLTIFQFIAVLMAVITLFSVANAVNMAVSERVGEIGTLRSLGFQRSTVRKIFLFEGSLLGLCGTVVGALVAVVAAVAINVSGMSWTPPGRSEAIPIFVDVISAPEMIVATVLGLTLVACLSALWPANRAARLEVTEALRHA